MYDFDNLIQKLTLNKFIILKLYSNPMIEDLHTEFKRDWDQKYLRNVAAMANTDGGVIYVGISDDGSVCGVSNLPRLLKVIPDMIQARLGITPEVDHQSKDGKDFITITISKSKDPIFFDGKLFKKSGSTTRELKHAEAKNFLVRKYGSIWTEDPCPSVSLDELDNVYFAEFRKVAAASGKLNKSESELSTRELMDKLKLTVDGKPKLGAVLLFHPEPERFSRGAYVKIGMFIGSDILYEDRLSGPLFMLPNQVLQMLMSKYTIVPVKFEGITRIEKPPYPSEALREIILNAIIHSDYSADVEIQIKVYPDHIEFYNSGAPPEDWTVEYLVSAHRSIPGNPTLAEVFYRAGKIESFGRGIQKVLDQYKGRSAKPPEFSFDSSSFSVVAFNENPIISTDSESISVGLSDRQTILLRSMTANPATLIELMRFVSSTSRESFRRNVLKPLLEKGFVAMTIKDKPNSQNQKYILTDLGWKFKQQ